MNQETIKAAIPHRGPMLLIDEIVERSDDSIHCRKTFRPDEFFFQGHYPDNPIVPGVILCECAAQAGAILLSSLMQDDPSGVPVLTKMENVRFKQMIRPEDTIDIQCRLEDRLSGAWFLVGQIRAGGKLAARLNFVCTLAESE